MSIHETMYRVVLAERDYERTLVKILRADLETLREQRRQLLAEVEHRRNASAELEKWKGLALAKGGDGRTLNEIQRREHELIAERDAAHAELRKLWAGHHVLFDREVYDRVMKP